MAKLNTERFFVGGKSNISHEFEVFSFDTTFKKYGGVFVFTKRTKAPHGYNHLLVFIGKTEDLSTVLENYGDGCIKVQGANSILVKYVISKDERDEVEADLYDKYNTICKEDRA